MGNLFYIFFFDRESNITVLKNLITESFKQEKTKSETKAKYKSKVQAKVTHEDLHKDVAKCFLK